MPPPRHYHKRGTITVDLVQWHRNHPTLEVIVQEAEGEGVNRTVFLDTHELPLDDAGAQELYHDISCLIEATLRTLWGIAPRMDVDPGPAHAPAD